MPCAVTNRKRKTHTKSRRVCLNVPFLNRARERVKRVGRGVVLHNLSLSINLVSDSFFLSGTIGYKLQHIYI